MANYKVAYGKRENITTAINRGIIPPGCIILTEDSNEIFFYDLSKNLVIYESRSKFSSKIEAEEWVKRYDCSGQIVSIREGSKCNAYIVDYSGNLVGISSSSSTVSVQADFLIDDPEDPGYIKNKPKSVPINFVEGLEEVLDSKVRFVNKVIPGALVTADSTGNLESSTVTLQELMSILSKKIDAPTKIIEGSLMIATSDGNLRCSNISEEDIVLKEDIIVGSSVASVKLESSGVYLVNIPESVMKYPTIHVYHNGMLLVENIHYTVSDKFITLIGHATYSGDIFSFVGYGSAGNLLDLDVYHQHNNKEVLDHITQDMVDRWNSSTPADGSFVTKEELFDESGKIFSGLLPEGSLGGLVLGDTEDTAFRGDLGAIAYEHSQEDHAPANAQENKIEEITLGGTSLPIVNKTVNIPVGNEESLGVVKSSTEHNKIFIEEDGTMSVTSIDATKMIVPEGEELILVSGDSQK